MGPASNKGISLHSDLCNEREGIARKEGKTISTVIREAMRVVKRERLKSKILDTQQYWTRKAKENGILTERDLQQYLAR
ncbi:MAG: hypothetical protein ABIP82_10650 [Nitrospirales bacterium]